jgi:peptidoglycan hydrolase-like protein with peptidoglycan-binding domain
MAALEASSHDHTVKGQSNAIGEIGIGFSPSFIGGENYRWRIFVDPVNSRASDGTEAHAVKFETGRFCIKKHVLWSKLISKPSPTFAASNTVLGMQERLSSLGYDTGVRDGIAGRRTRGAIGVFQTHDASLPQSGQADHENENHAATQLALDMAITSYLTRAGGAVGNINFTFIEDQFELMHNTLEVEPEVKLATPLTEAEYLAAIQWARTQVQATPPPRLTQRYNIEAMFEDYFNTPFLFDVKEPRYYNRARGRGFPRARRGAALTAYSNYWRDVDRVIYGTGGMLEKLFLYISGQASVASPPTASIDHNSSPGLTVITASRASPIMIANSTPQTSVKTPRGYTGSGNASGIGGSKRACTVFYGRGLYNNWPYQGDGFSRNTMHEMGHVLYKRHHNTGAAANSGFPADHDTSDRCVMGYRFCEGEYCGKCHLKLRGWDISQLAP